MHQVNRKKHASFNIYSLQFIVFFFNNFVYFFSKKRVLFYRFLNIFENRNDYTLSAWFRGSFNHFGAPCAHAIRKIARTQSRKENIYNNKYQLTRITHFQQRKICQNTTNVFIDLRLVKSTLPDPFLPLFCFAIILD